MPLPMKPIRTLIADDEPPARETLRLLLASDPSIEIAGEAANGNEAAQRIEELRPDLLFLDIRMPGLNGFEVIESMRGGPMSVVFVTAYDEYAVDAFRAEALDYLLKPFDDARFFQTLARVKERHEEREWSAAGRFSNLLEGRKTGPTPVDRVVIRSGNRIAIVPSRDIDWVEAADNYVILHVGPKTHLLRQTMQEMTSSLDPAVFLRVHRSAAVNLRSIRELRVESHGEAVAILENQTEVRVSRHRRQDLETALARVK